jgi:hypothetical protein
MNVIRSHPAYVNGGFAGLLAGPIGFIVTPVAYMAAAIGMAFITNDGDLLVALSYLFIFAAPVGAVIAGVLGGFGAALVNLGIASQSPQATRSGNALGATFVAIGVLTGMVAGAIVGGFVPAIGLLMSLSSTTGGP